LQIFYLQIFLVADILLADILSCRFLTCRFFTCRHAWLSDDFLLTDTLFLTIWIICVIIVMYTGDTFITRIGPDKYQHSAMRSCNNELRRYNCSAAIFCCSTPDSYLPRIAIGHSQFPIYNVISCALCSSWN